MHVARSHQQSSVAETKQVVQLDIVKYEYEYMYYWPFLVAHLCKCQMLFAPQKEVLMSKFATIGEMLMQMYAHQVVRIFFFSLSSTPWI